MKKMLHLHLFIIISLVIILSAVSYKTIPLDKSNPLLHDWNSGHYDASEVISRDNISLDMLLYYSYFATVGYCRDHEFLEGTCCSSMLYNKTNPDWEVIYHGESEEDTNVNFAFIKSDKYKKLVLAFPGTRHNFDIFLQVLQSELVPLFPESTDENIKKIKVFQKFHEHIMGWVDKIFTPEIIDLLQNKIKGYQLWFIGHSLGGAMSSLAAEIAIVKGYINPKELSTVLFTLGQPRTGNYPFAKILMDNISVILRNVRQGDLVATVPPCTIDDDGKCMKEYGDANFNREFWHVGGEIVLNNELTEIYICDYNQAEDLEGVCYNKGSLNGDNHADYYKDDKPITSWC